MFHDSVTLNAAVDTLSIVDRIDVIEARVGGASHGAGPIGFVHVAAFTEVVNSGSFTAAARRMQLSKATVSKRVAHLEKRLGISLLARTTRSLRMTDQGERLYLHCKKILDEWAAAESDLVRLKGAPRGELRLRVPSYVEHQKALPAIHEFMAKHPEIKIKFNLSGETYESDAGDADVALWIGPAQPIDGYSTRLAPCVRLVCGAPFYLERYGVPATISELSRHNCLRLGNSENDSVWHLEGANGLESVAITGGLCANSGAALRDAALSGLGLALLPEPVVCDDLLAGRLVEIFPEMRDRSHTFQMALAAADAGANSAAQFFVTYIKAYYGALAV